MCKEKTTYFTNSEYELDEDGYPIIKLDLNKVTVCDTIDEDGFTILPSELDDGDDSYFERYILNDPEAYEKYKKILQRKRKK